MPKQADGNEKKGALIWLAIFGIWAVFLTIFPDPRAYSLTSSEDAFLIVDNIRFLHGEPTSDADGFDIAITIKNVGKHTAQVTRFNLQLAVFIKRKTLPEVPPYEGHDLEQAMHLIGPDKIVTVNARAHTAANSEIADADRLAGALNGAIPVRIFGLIEYKGVPSRKPGIVGYCQEYVPANRRKDVPFETCDNPDYTYTH